MVLLLATMRLVILPLDTSIGQRTALVLRGSLDTFADERLLDMISIITTS
jgi:hypothetical protein